MAPSHPDPLIGKVLNGRFRVVDRIGAGGMGRVYKAVQEPIDRLVALKVLNPRYDGQKDPGFERRFFLEASMTAKLKHPNTITVHDYGRTDDGIYYIAMEYLEGETLQSVLRRGPIAWPRALAIGGQIARSLREAHKLGMVHRDLKPANIMILSAEGTAGDLVKVLDFGLVKSFLGEKDAPAPEEDEEAALENESLTQEGVLLGSPLYMAPEQARREADGRTDIYALGTVLFQCIAGRTPFQGRESIDILVKQVRETPPQLRQFAAKVPQEVNDLVMHCLEKSPDARFQSMEELLEAMRVALDGHGMSGTFIDPRFPTSPSEMDTAPSIAVVANDPRNSPSPTSSIDEGAMSAAKKTEQVTPSNAPKIGVAVMALALVVGVGYAQLRGPPRPGIDPAPIENVSVTFQVDSEPSGARVHRDGVDGVAGTTPFSLVLTQRADETARVELTFSLDGYEEATVLAQGTDGTVPVMQVLKKLPEPGVDDPPADVAEAGQNDPLAPTNPPVKKPVKPPAGFKADPYQ